MEEIQELREKIEQMESTRVAVMIVLAVLIQTHQDYEKMQLQLTALLEQQLAGGALGNTLTAEQKESARDVVEWLQALKKK